MIERSNRRNNLRSQCREQEDSRHPESGLSKRTNSWWLGCCIGKTRRQSKLTVRTSDEIPPLTLRDRTLSDSELTTGRSDQPSGPMINQLMDPMINQLMDPMINQVMDPMINQVMDPMVENDNSDSITRWQLNCIRESVSILDGYMNTLLDDDELETKVIRMKDELKAISRQLGVLQQCQSCQSTQQDDQLMKELDTPNHDRSVIIDGIKQTDTDSTEVGVTSVTDKGSDTADDSYEENDNKSEPIGHSKEHLKRGTESQPSMLLTRLRSQPSNIRIILGQKSLRDQNLQEALLNKSKRVYELEDRVQWLENLLLQRESETFLQKHLQNENH